MTSHALCAGSLLIVFAFESASQGLADDSELTSRTIAPRPLTAGALVSSNSPPRLHPRGLPENPTFPPGFKNLEQHRVAEVYAALSANFERVLPDLIAHLDDERYAVTTESPSGVWYNETVGSLCHRLIRQNIALHERMCRREVWVESTEGFPTKTAAVRQWLKARKERPLWQMQHEWIAWAIQREREIPFKDPIKDATRLGRLEKVERECRETQQPIQVNARLVLYQK